MKHHNTQSITKGLIYYTDCRVEEPIRSVVREQLTASGLPIVSCSLNEPIEFGNNDFVNGERSYPTMVRQILSCLERSTADYIFFCEHDVLYPQSHFDFTPLRDDMFYYNANVWRWDYPTDRAITYDRLISLSGLCASRELLLKHYKERQRLIDENGWNNDHGEPDWARRMGYEPGTKKIKRGGYFDDDFETWSSADPMIDIRHTGTFSKPKVTLDSFKHQPTNWKETSINQIGGWNLRSLFHL